MELKQNQRVIVIDTVKNWPKNLDSKQLLEKLDDFAKQIIRAEHIPDRPLRNKQEIIEKYGDDI